MKSFVSSTNMFRVHTSDGFFISHFSEIIFLPVKNRIEIILFFQNALCPSALFPPNALYPSSY